MSEKNITHQSEREPPTALFNPMDEPRWTLPMTCAWIMWRDVGRVRDFWDRFQAERAISRPVIRTSRARDNAGTLVVNMEVLGSEVEQAPKPSLDRIDLTRLHDSMCGADPSSKVVPSLNSCLSQVLEKSIDGAIRITGMSEDTGKREHIACEELPSLKVSYYFEDSGDGSLRFSEGRRTGQIAYTNLLFDRTEILRQWPEVLTSGADGGHKGPPVKRADRSVTLTPSEKEIARAINVLWPEGNIPHRPVERDRAIQDHISSHGNSPPSRKTIDRYFRKLA